jgi:hypothetical protein
MSTEVEIIDPGTSTPAPVKIEAEEETLTVEDANKITEAISHTTGALWSLLYTAHSRKAHLALGYKTWNEYIDAEFGISRSAAHALVTQGAVIETLTSVAPEGTKLHFTQAQARAVKKSLDAVASIAAERTVGKTPEEAQEIINEIVAEREEQDKADREALKAKREAERQKKLEAEREMYEAVATQIINQAAQEAGYSLTGEDTGQAGEYSLTGEDEEANTSTTDSIDSAEPKEPQSETNRKAIALRGLYTAIGHVSAIPEPQEALSIIPQERISKTHSELSAMEQKIHDIIVALEEKYGKSILTQTMTS